MTRVRSGNRMVVNHVEAAGTPRKGTVHEYT